MIARADEGLPKLFVVQRALAERRRHPERFGPRSRYVPAVRARAGGGARVRLRAHGPRLRRAAARHARSSGWGDTELELPAGRHRDVFSGERFAGGVVSVARLFARFPVALLTSEEDEP